MEPRFEEYARIVSNVSADELMAVVKGFPLPENGMVYSPREDDLHAVLAFIPWGEALYADMPYQLGYCAGSNDRADTLVRHGGSTFLQSDTEIDLLLAHRWEQEPRCFRIPADTLVELFGDTLRSAPLGRNFRVLVILPFATNTAWQDGKSRNTWTVKAE